MRKYILAFIIIFMPAFAMAEVSSIDRGYSESIKSYGVEATLQDNGTMDITEAITYDFGNNEKHGIFRFVPVVYEGRIGNPRQSLRVHSVTDDADNPIRFEQTNENNSEIIKIGDPNQLITGLHTYKIDYSLNHMVSSEADGDRFRWDAIGTGWTVPIDNVVIKLSTSNHLVTNRETIDCYTGITGSTASCEYLAEGNELIVGMDSLVPGEGLTIDSLYQSGTFPAPSSLEIFLWEKAWYYWLPLMAFLGFFAFWYEKGRDPKGRGTIVPMYDPPKGITPFESTIILDDMINKKALPAAIISLATQGYIRIHRKEVKVLFTTRAEYELELVKPLPKTASPVEQRVSNLFFIGRTRVSLNDLGDSFAQLNQSLHRVAYEEVVNRGYFVVNPNISRFIFFGISAALLVFGILTAVYLLTSPLGYLCFILPGVIALVFAFIMPVKTKLGAQTKEDLLGLKMYIRVAEADRIKFHNAPAKSPEKFEELLPYAIIFGLEKEWAEEFKDIYKTPPSWYDGNITTFSVIALTHDIGSFSDAAIASAVSASADAGGGGFSGGGGGGGGGGSW